MLGYIQTSVSSIRYLMSERNADRVRDASGLVVHNQELGQAGRTQVGALDGGNHSNRV